MTCAEGGLIATDDDALADRLRCLKFHGLAVDAFDRQQLGRKPQAEVVEPGYKYNLSDIHAAIAVVQLSRFAELNARRKALAQRYLSALEGSPFNRWACRITRMITPGICLWSVSILSVAASIAIG